MHDKGLGNPPRRHGHGLRRQRARANTDDFGRPIQAFITEHRLGAGVGREASRARRAGMLNLAMLAILNRTTICVDTAGAITNGVTEEEMREVFPALSASTPAAPADARLRPIAKGSVDRGWRRGLSPSEHTRGEMVVSTARAVSCPPKRGTR